jgi:pimeloyl-ACP methyl ester carboxylesterase
MVGRRFRELSISVVGSGRAQVANYGLQPDWTRPVTLLLPGYNSDPKSASDAFQRLFERMKCCGQPTGQWQFRSWLIHWPGYASWGLSPGRTFFSPLTYPLQIPSARLAAEALKRFIDSATPKPPILNLIAHSLGCRVALELLEAYDPYPPALKPRFLRVLLIAAAVPWDFLKHGGRLRKGTALPARLMVFYSRHDGVLTGPFRLGQTIAKEGVFPKAVGATGRPAGLYHRTVRTRNSHSSYFDDWKTGAEILGELGTVQPKALPSFVGDAEAAPILHRELPTAPLATAAAV